MSKILHRGLEAKLAALNDPEWESSDEDEEMPTDATTTTTTTTLTNNETTTKSIRPTKTEPNESSSRVIYIGHIPPAFEETQLLQFLSQFGSISNIKLSRSKRTGNSRGYAFVEFVEHDVASIVAHTLSGYFLLGERRLVCHIVPMDKIHPNLFVMSKRNLLANKQSGGGGGVDATSKLEQWQSKNRKEVNGTKSVEGLKKITQRLLKRESDKRKKLKSLGIEYDFPGYEASVNKKKAEEEAEVERKKKEAEKKKKVKKTPSKKTKARKAVTEVKKAKKRSKRRLSQS